MFDAALFLPVLAQVAITAVLGAATAVARWTAAGKREVLVKDIALGQLNWPKRCQQISNAFNNQWESPTLLYAGVAFAMIAGEGGALLVGLAWAYVATRLVHAGIYVTTNYIPHRFAAFLTGFAALLAFWVVLAARVVVA
jgi:hypothetical protein